MNDFTPSPDLNRVLLILIAGMKSALKEKLLGVYLGGSFAHGGWDQYSDVDFDAVIAEDLDPDELTGLKAVHAGVYSEDCYYARHLEGAYFPKSVLGDLARTEEAIWYLDNGSLNFERSTHDNTLVNRWVLRERGIRLMGPDPKTWIPHIPGNLLKREVLRTMLDWGREILSGAYELESRWAQTFAVLSYCRMLHTMAIGEIHSKPAGASWAKANLDVEWMDLIDDALSARPNQYENVYQPAKLAAVERTKEFICYAIIKAQNDQQR